MRNIYLFALLIAVSAVQVAAAEDAKADKNRAPLFHLELYGDSQKTGGARAQTSLAEVRAAARPESEKSNFGILFSTEKLCKKLPVEIKYGNLSFSGSLSKLNSPELSNGTSPFTSGIISAACLSANLPSYSSFSKDQSCFLQVKLQHIKKSPLAFTINLALEPESSASIFSTLISNSFFLNQLTLSAACTAGNFLYEDNDSTSWILDTPYYAADRQFASLFQLSAVYKPKSGKSSLQSTLMTALYESPFGPYNQIWRADLKLSIKQTEFFTSAFLNSYEKLLTSSEKEIDPCAQVKTGLITKKPFLTKSNRLFFIKSGINASTKINLTQNEHPIRVNTGIQLSSELTSISLSLSLDSKMKAPALQALPQSIEKDKVSFQINNSWYLKKLTPALGIKIEENKYKFSVNISNNAASSKHRFSGNCALTLSTRDGKVEDKKFSAACSCRINFKYLTIIGKLSTSLE